MTGEIVNPTCISARCLHSRHMNFFWTHLCQRTIIIDDRPLTAMASIGYIESN